VVFDGGMDVDRNGNKAEGKNTGADRPSHSYKINNRGCVSLWGSFTAHSLSDF
jgi:hypothetical protein